MKFNIGQLVEVDWCDIIDPAKSLIAPIEHDGEVGRVAAILTSPQGDETIYLVKFVEHSDQLYFEYMLKRYVEPFTLPFDMR